MYCNTYLLGKMFTVFTELRSYLILNMKIKWKTLVISVYKSLVHVVYPFYGSSLAITFKRVLLIIKTN